MVGTYDVVYCVTMLKDSILPVMITMMAGAQLLLICDQISVESDQISLKSDKLAIVAQNGS